MRVREAEVRDAAAMIALVQQLAAEPDVDVPLAPGEYDRSIADQEAQIRWFQASESSTFLLAEEAGELLGMASLRSESRRATRHAAELGMNVGRAHRNRGIGTRLLGAVVDWARASPFLTRVELDVYVRNAPAIALYEGAGFETEGIRRAAVRERESYVDSRRMALLFEDKKPVFGDPAPGGVPEPPLPPDEAVAPIEVRRARPEDAPQIETHVLGLIHEPDVLIPLATDAERPDAEERVRTIALHGERPNWLYLVATSGTRLAGILSAKGSPRAALRHAVAFGMSVGKPWRRRGVGTRLLEALIGWARDTGFVKRIELTVYAENAAAIGLYEKCGFEREGRRRNAFFQRGRYYDDLMLARLL